jgi:hypothetical protein
VQLREFACRGREFVVGDHHGFGAILHGRARHHFLNGTRADRAGLPLALNGKAIGPLADDDVNAPVAGDGRHDHRNAARPYDPCDIVLELRPRHLGGYIVAGAQADECAAQEKGHRGEQGGTRTAKIMECATTAGLSYKRTAGRAPMPHRC